MIQIAFLNVPVDLHLASSTVRATKNVQMDALVMTIILIIAMILVFPITMTSIMNLAAMLMTNAH